MAGFKLFSGGSHPDLSQKVAEQLGISLSVASIKKFANNEIYIRLEESVRGKHVYIVQTFTSNVNEEYMELFILCDTLKRSFAKSVHVIIPHFGYARQDRVSQSRETISAQLMANLLATSGVDHTVAFTLHSDQIQGFFPFPVDNIDAGVLFVDYFKKLKLKNAIIVSPDVGGAKQAKKFADKLGYPLAILNKIRSAHNVSEVAHVVGDVEGKTCIVYDDMIDTAGSVCNAREALLKAGAGKDVYLVATHAVFSHPAEERLKEAKFKEILVTDSIPLGKKKIPNVQVLSLAPLISAIIQRIDQEQPVSVIYDRLL